MIAALSGIVGARNLLVEWTARTLRARYQQSVLGWLWAIIQPAAQALIFAVVFTHVVPVDTGSTPYLLFVFVATAPWAFLSASLTDMTTSIVDNMTLVNKVHFVRSSLPIATMLARLADLGVTLACAIVLAAVWGLQPLSPAIVLLPVVVAVQMLLIVGVGLAAAASNVFVRDVRSILQLGIQMWFYLSPVLYPADRVPAAFRRAYEMNPMVGILDAYRAVLLHGALPDASFAVAAVMSVAVAVAGSAVFTRLEPRFADVI